MEDVKMLSLTLKRVYLLLDHNVPQEITEEKVVKVNVLSTKSTKSKLFSKHERENFTNKTLNNIIIIHLNIIVNIKQFSTLPTV